VGHELHLNRSLRAGASPIDNDRTHGSPRFAFASDRVNL
jgi:hypothetical protein